MGETKKNIQYLEKLASTSEGLRELFPEGEISIMLGLTTDQFKEIQRNFRTIDNNFNQFKIEFSDVELYLYDKNVEIKNDEVEPKPNKGAGGKFINKLGDILTNVFYR